MNKIMTKWFGGRKMFYGVSTIQILFGASFCMEEGIYKIFATAVTAVACALFVGNGMEHIGQGKNDREI